MRKCKIVGMLAVATTFLFAGCSGSVEFGPVPTITPRPTVTPAPTPTPVVVESTDDVEEENVYETKKFLAYYEKENELPQLKVAYQDIFTIGLEALQIDVTEAKRKELVKNQFGSISCKQDLSPNYIMDLEASAASGDLKHISLDFSGADVILKFAQENNLPVRGPRLITNETPVWAFTKDFSEDQVVTTTEEDGTETTTVEFASADVMLARMENYIKDVITYCNTNYPDVVVSWDVLDDVINTGDNHELGYRSTSYWHQSIGEEYLVKACELARKYAAPEQKLIYAQSTLDNEKTRNAALALIELLQASKLIDGVGIQASYNPNSPNVFDMNTMFEKLAATGLEIHLTEFHIDSNEGNSGDADKTPEERMERSTKRYKSLMNTYKNFKVKNAYNLVSITFECLSNDTSTLNQPKNYYDTVTGETVYGVKVESFPGFFDKDMNVLNAFFAALGDVDIKSY